jgi:hypothetical protein
MMAPHWREDMAPVPESVSQSISTSSARSLKTLSRASASSRSRSARVVIRMGSTDLMRKGSIRVLGMARHREGMGAGEAITARPAVVSVVANSPL